MNHLDNLEQTLTADLRRLSEQAPEPDTDPAADLGRARQAVRRTRLRIAGGGVLGAAMLIIGGLVAGLIIGGTTPGQIALPADTPTSTPKFRYSDPEPDAPCRAEPGRQRSWASGPASPRFQHQLDLLGPADRVLAEHLDPEGRYLQKGIEQMDGSCTVPGTWSLGSRLTWSLHQETSRGAGGEVRVTVATKLGAVQSQMECGAAWQCEEVDVNGLPGVERVRIGTFATGFAAIVERTDGEVVVLIANRKHTFRFDRPVDSFPFDADDLVEAAADPRLTVKR